MKKKIFIGVSWPYANGELHLGHITGQYVSSDIFARYHRLRGNKVLMVSGSDCHGAPIQFAADRDGITPAELVSKSHKNTVKLYKELDFLYDNFTTTTTDIHTKIVQDFFTVLKQNHYLIKRKSKQYWDPEVKKFLPDRYVRGTCPYCGEENARGDECPQCGKFLTPEELKNPRSTLSSSTPVLKEVEHYYLDLSKFSKKLTKWLKDKTFWKKWVLEFTKGRIKQGLEPRPITRDMSWGIPVPEKGWEDKVIYVWFDAVIGYLSASVEWAQQHGTASAWEDFWKDPASKHFYFIAGGNVPFHTIIWPSQIIGYNEKYNKKVYEPLPGEKQNKPLQLPYHVPANKMLLFQGKKMSKGDLTGVFASNLVKKYSSDHIRFYCTRYAPENHDRDFSWKDFIDVNNNDLVANIGNFIYRVLTFTKNNFDNTVPSGKIDNKVAKAIKKAFTDTAKHLENTEFVKATKDLLKLGQFANRYFNQEQPWLTIKTDRTKAGEAIYNTLQLVKAFSTLLKPFTPKAALQLSQMLNIQDEYDPNQELAQKNKVTQFIDQWKYKELQSGHKLNSPKVLFQKLEYTEKLQQQDKSITLKPSNKQLNNQKIQYQDFAEIEIRVGQVIKVSAPVWSHKLYELTVDFGNLGQKIIYAGLKKWFKPTDLQNKKFLFVYNMAPKKVGQGISDGMFLAAGDKNVWLIPVPKEIPVGEKIS